jgi:hypothetical protein
VLASVARAEQLETATPTANSSSPDPETVVDLASAVESPQTFSVEIPLPEIVPIVELAPIAVTPPLQVSFPPLPDLASDGGITLPTSVVNPAAIPLSLSQPTVALHDELPLVASHEKDVSIALVPSEALPAVDPTPVDGGPTEEQAHGALAVEQSVDAADLDAASIEADQVAASDNNADAMHAAQHAEWAAQADAELAQEQVAAEQAAVEQAAVDVEAQAAEAEHQAHELDAAVDVVSADAACEIPADTPIL